MFALFIAAMLAAEEPRCDSFAPGLETLRPLQAETVDPAALPPGEIACLPAADNSMERRLDGAIDGVAFHVRLKDGLAAVKSGGPDGYWIIRCAYDATLDTLVCGASQDDLVVALVNGHLKVKVGSDYYVPSDIALRVDQNPPHLLSSEDAGSWDHEALYEELLAGREARTRYTQLIDGRKDATTSLAGLRAAAALMRILYGQMERLPPS